jgi:hypothetical protein
MNALLTPPLPAAWPYQPRTALPAWPLHQNLDLGVFGPGWTSWGTAARLEEVAPLGGAFGRGGVVRAGDLVIRPYRRGGLVRFVNAATYASPRRFRDEAQVHRYLWEAGLPTVEPLGCAWRRSGVGVEGLYFTRWVEAHPWARSFDPAAWPQIETLIFALSDLGCWVPDLNATNLLVQADGRVLALDFDRAGFRGGDLRAAYRARLQRSLRKLGAPQAVLALLEPAP